MKDQPTLRMMIGIGIERDMGAKKSVMIEVNELGF